MLYYKAWVEDKFKWPKGDEEQLTLTGQQLHWLLDGYDISTWKGHKNRHYKSVFLKKKPDFLSISVDNLPVLHLKSVNVCRN